MSGYRERTREQEAVQEERDRMVSSHTSVGFNLFCLEYKEGRNIEI